MFVLWESNCLLVTHQNDNHSPGPGPGPGRLVSSSHQRSEFSNTILCTFSRGGKEVWKCIPIPNGLGEKTTLMNISISTGYQTGYQTCSEVYFDNISQIQLANQFYSLFVLVKLSELDKSDRSETALTQAYSHYRPRLVPSWQYGLPVA